MPPVNLSRQDAIVETSLAVHQEAYPDWTLDELLLHPTDAHKFTEEVQRRMHLSRLTLPDHEILRTYLNARKRGALSPSRRSKTSRLRKTKKARRSLK